MWQIVEVELNPALSYFYESKFCWTGGYLGIEYILPFEGCLLKEIGSKKASAGTRKRDKRVSEKFYLEDFGALG